MSKYIIVFFLLGALNVFGEDETLHLSRVDASLIFDGKLDEPFWKNMVTVTTLQHAPINGNASAGKENIYLAYDDKYLYLAGNMYGEDIRSPSKKRDEFSLTTDWLGILIDGYNDQENALSFFTTPSGLRSDFAIFEDAIGNMPVNLDWNTYWDVKTYKGTNMWSVEMRIPFSSLQFQDDGDEVSFGVIVWKAIAAENEISTWPLIPNEWGEWSHMKPSKAKKIVLKGIKSSKPLYISPYVASGGTRVVDEKAPYNVELDGQLSAGLDVKYNITSNITLDFTLNTDFAQVEADDAQVNLDRFNLFFPEKRQFFQERASIFDLRVGGSNRVFYSRRIGIDDDGNLEKILGGVRMTGRVGNYDIGLINIATRDDQWSPKNNATVLRLRKKVFNSNSYIGFIGTNKTNFDGGYNSVYGLDGTFRLAGNNLLQMRWAQSFTDEYENKLFSHKPSRFFINLEKTQFLGFNYDLALATMGADYNPELGFEGRSNFSSVFAVIGYGWRRDASSPILQHDVRMYNFGFFKNDSGLDETLNTGASFTTAWKSGHTLNVFSYLRRERLFESTNILDDFTVDAGTYPINVWSVEYGTPSSGRAQYSISVRGGDIFDSKFYRLEQNVDWNATPSLNLGLYYNYNPIYKKGWDGQRIDVHLARLKFLYTLNTKTSLNGFLQATSEGNIGLGNIRFRYNPREGVDFFLVYNNATDLGLGTDAEQAFRRRIPEQVLIGKFTYTLRL